MPRLQPSVTSPSHRYMSSVSPTAHHRTSQGCHQSHCHRRCCRRRRRQRPNQKSKKGSRPDQLPSHQCLASHAVHHNLIECNKAATGKQTWRQPHWQIPLRSRGAQWLIDQPAEDQPTCCPPYPPAARHDRRGCWMLSKWRQSKTKIRHSGNKQEHRIGA